MFHSEPQQARPRLCPSCGTLVGATASKCHECGASMTFSLAAASRSLSTLLPTASPVTYFVLGLNIILFVVAYLSTLRITASMGLLGRINGDVGFRMGASVPLPALLYSADAGGQWWRLVTAGFLHWDLLHIGMNTWVLMDVGPQVEEVYGSARYLFLYVATTIGGFAVSSFAGRFAAGASAALMGLIGLMLAITTRRGGAYMRMVRGQLVRWVIYIFAFGLLISGIDNFGHLGGLASGFLLGKIFEDRQPMNSTERTRAYALGWIAGLIVAVSFALMLMQYFRTANLPTG